MQALNYSPSFFVAAIKVSDCYSIFLSLSIYFRNLVIKIVILFYQSILVRR